MTLLSLFFLHLLAVASPGPDFFVTLKYALGDSRKSAFAVALGITAANMLHITYSLAGIGVIIAHSIVLFSFFKYAAAAYLFFLGWKSWRSSTKMSSQKRIFSQKSTSFFTALRTGFLTSILNPKATLYYVMLFSVLIDPATLSFVSLGRIVVMMLGVVFLWFLLVGFFFSRPRVSHFFSASRRLFDRIFGTLLIVLGVRIATEK